MAAVSHGWKPDKATVPVKVAKEYHAADKAKGKYMHKDRLLAQGKKQ